MQRLANLPILYKILNAIQCKNQKNYHTLHNRLLRLHYTDKILNRITFRLYSEVALKCWNCGAQRPGVGETLICTSCKSLQRPLETTNYFTVLNVEQDFDIDAKTLTNTYRQLQSVLHPDKYSNKSREERDISLNYSSLVNKAYNTLQVPLKRALHLLALNGVKIDEDQKIAEPEFLMLMMELNEEIDAASTPGQLKELDRKNKAEMDKINSTLSTYFKQKKFKDAKDQIIKMKYYNSIRMRINELLRERGIVE